jgi:hypothetical protein
MTRKTPIVVPTPVIPENALFAGEQRPGSVEAAVSRDLAALPPDLATSALAMLALALAREVDGENSATSKSMCAGQLRDTLAQLRELAPSEEEADELDDLARRRATRRSGGAAT